MFYQCPVCGYNEMQFPPSEHNICPCCSTEFGYDDFSKSHRVLRNEWLAHGANWFSYTTIPPFTWNGFRQVIEAGFPFDVPAPTSNVKSFFIKAPVFVQKEFQVQVS
jgi:hypothetical protein